VDIVTGETKPIPRDYHAIITHEDLHRLVTVLEMSECCTVDTESSGKDPYGGAVWNIDFSQEGRGVLCPTAAHDLSGIDRSSVVSVLRRLLAGSIKVTGHNLKYDYVLLRKHGIEIANVDLIRCLPLMIALAIQIPESAIPREAVSRGTIKSHGEIVPANQSLLDLPFCEIVDYACTHADMTL
jgi:hypothetical protein